MFDPVMACCIQDDSYEHYKKEGLTEEEAKKRAEQDAWAAGLIFQR